MQQQRFTTYIEFRSEFVEAVTRGSEVISTFQYPHRYKLNTAPPQREATKEGASKKYSLVVILTKKLFVKRIKLPHVPVHPPPRKKKKNRKNSKKLEKP